jgi:hypothetical protein
MRNFKVWAVIGFVIVGVILAAVGVLLIAPPSEAQDIICGDVDRCSSALSCEDKSPGTQCVVGRPECKCTILKDASGNERCSGYDPWNKRICCCGCVCASKTTVAIPALSSTGLALLAALLVLVLAVMIRRRRETRPEGL